MRYNKRHRRASAVMGINLTPMVDVIFLLTIFFMLVSRFSSAEQVPMDLPKPENSRAQVPSMPERVIVNCRLVSMDDASGGPAAYSIGPNRPEPLDVISDRLAAMKRASPGLKVVVRADRRIRYQYVRALMRVIANNGIDMLNVVAHVKEDD